MSQETGKRKEKRGREKERYDSNIPGWFKYMAIKEY